jgi:preprotein translocase subunit Sec63
MDSTDILAALITGAVGYGVVTLFLNRYSTKSANSGKPWWEILGVSPDASRDEARIAYWNKIQEFQPDKINQLGPELRKAATSCAVELNKAVDESEKRFAIGRQ